ncbi:hypothetical protein BKA61DRAFT_741754 [Leptodontidium sp. MPI-SDFR-AT-0119]|nr:hypothetical protein BKA61DRAFT_741754 [Leptodontidium sp. MPI-SDFR-AT-0119]
MANLKLLLIFTLIHSAVCQVGYIFLSTQYPDCNSCLDQTGLSCTGHYQTPRYAKCMCKGDGFVKVNTCVSVCNSVDTNGYIASNIANQFYGYCVQFYRDMCPEAQGILQTDIYEENCGANAGPGLADSAESSPSTKLSTSEIAETATAVTSTDSDTQPTPTATRAGASGTATTATSAGSSATVSAGATTTPSSGAAVALTPLPIWGMMIGLGIRMAGMIV